MTDGPYPNYLAGFMRAAGMTDPALADRLGVSKQQIFNLRHGQRKLTVEWAKRIAPHLRVSWQELVTGPLAAPSDNQRAELLAAFDAMDERDREALLRVAQRMRRDDPPPEPPPHPAGNDPHHRGSRASGH